MTESGERLSEKFLREHLGALQGKSVPVTNTLNGHTMMAVDINDAKDYGQAAFEAGSEDGPTPVYVCAKAERDIPRILAAVMDSLIAQHAPDSISGYAIMDAILPFLVEMKSVPELPAPSDSGDKKNCKEVE